MGGINIYNEIHISNTERNTNENVWLDPGISPWTLASLVNIQGSSSRTITFLPLQILCSQGNTKQTEDHPVRTN